MDDLFDRYNPLYDSHLKQYFALPHMQRHLKRIGLIEDTVDVCADGGENSRCHALVDAMIKNRESRLTKFALLQKKLEAAEKIEICRRIRNGLSMTEPFHKAKPSRSLSRGTQKLRPRRRGSSVGDDERDLIKKIEAENEEPQPKYHTHVFNRLSANIIKYRFLHKLDDSTLATYMEGLKRELEKLDRFRAITFGPYSVARHHGEPQQSWFFRRRSTSPTNECQPADNVMRNGRLKNRKKRGRHISTHRNQSIDLKRLPCISKPLEISNVRSTVNLKRQHGLHRSRQDLAENIEKQGENRKLQKLNMEKGEEHNRVTLPPINAGIKSIKSKKASRKGTTEPYMNGRPEDVEMSKRSQLQPHNIYLETAQLNHLIDLTHSETTSKSESGNAEEYMHEIGISEAGDSKLELKTQDIEAFSNEEHLNPPTEVVAEHMFIQVKDLEVFEKPAQLQADLLENVVTGKWPECDLSNEVRYSERAEATGNTENKVQNPDQQPSIDDRHQSSHRKKESIDLQRINEEGIEKLDLSDLIQPMDSDIRTMKDDDSLEKHHKQGKKEIEKQESCGMFAEYIDESVVNIIDDTGESEITGSIADEPQEQMLGFDKEVMHVEVGEKPPEAEIILSGSICSNSNATLDTLKVTAVQLEILDANNASETEHEIIGDRSNFRNEALKNECFEIKSEPVSEHVRAKCASPENENTDRSTVCFSEGSPKKVQSEVENSLDNTTRCSEHLNLCDEQHKCTLVDFDRPEAHSVDEKRIELMQSIFKGIEDNLQGMESADLAVKSRNGGSIFEKLENQFQDENKTLSKDESLSLSKNMPDQALNGCQETSEDQDMQPFSKGEITQLKSAEQDAVSTNDSERTEVATEIIEMALSQMNDCKEKRSNNEKYQTTRRINSDSQNINNNSETTSIHEKTVTDEQNFDQLMGDSSADSPTHAADNKGGGKNCDEVVTKTDRVPIDGDATEIESRTVIENKLETCSGEVVSPEIVGTSKCDLINHDCSNETNSIDASRNSVQIPIFENCEVKSAAHLDHRVIDTPNESVFSNNYYASPENFLISGVLCANDSTKDILFSGISHQFRQYINCDDTLQTPQKSASNEPSAIDDCKQIEDEEANCQRKECVQTDCNALQPMLESNVYALESINVAKEDNVTDSLGLINESYERFRTDFLNAEDRIADKNANNYEVSVMFEERNMFDRLNGNPDGNVPSTMEPTLASVIHRNDRLLDEQLIQEATQTLI